MIRNLFSVAIVAALGLPAFAADKYKLDGDNAKIEFTGTKKDGKHVGGFKKLTGEVTNDGGWKIDVTIDTTSLFSDDEKLTGHLKAGDFFNVKDHPAAKFTTTKIDNTRTGFSVTGKLTLLGKEKEITFPAKITSGDTFTLKAEFKINRADFGMTYGEGKVDNEVSIKLDVNAKK